MIWSFLTTEPKSNNLWIRISDKKKFRTYQVQYKSDIDHRIQARPGEFLKSPMIVLVVYHTFLKINFRNFR